MNAKQRGLVFASKIGLDQELIELYNKLSGVSWGEFPVDETLQCYELAEDEREGDVLFTLVPAWGSLCYRVGALGHAFKTRGYRPVVLYDDFDLPIRPEFTVDNRDRLQAIRRRYSARVFAEQFGFESASIGELTNSSTYESLDTDSPEVSYRGVSLDGCAKSSTRKYLKQYSLDLSDPDVHKLYEQFLRGGAMLVDASKSLFERYDIAATITNEPNYIQGRVPLAVSEEEGVHTYTQKWGYQAGELLFGRTTNRHYLGQFADIEITETALSEDLTASEDAALSDIMSKWRNNEITRIEYTTGSGQSVETDADTVVGLFTNLLWDGALEPDHALYDDVYNWLADTIDIFANMNGADLVIKPHPAEHIRGTNESVGDWVRATYDELPENVTLLPPDTNIDTYELFNDLDLGIVYASTVGLEMVHDGIPVVTAGYPPYHGFNITYDPESKVEYREFVEQPDAHDCSEERSNRARRYFHFLFFCKHFDFPYHSGMDTSGNESEISTIRHRDIEPGNEPWDSIVQQILNGEEVLQPDCQTLKQ